MDQDSNLVIGCDTLVAFNNKVLGKPKDKKMLLKCCRL